MRKIIYSTVLISGFISGCNSDQVIQQQYAELSTKIDNLTQQIAIQNDQIQPDHMNAINEQTQLLHKDHQDLLKRINAVSEENEKLIETAGGKEKQNMKSDTNSKSEAQSQDKDVVYEAKDDTIATVDGKTIVGATEWVLLEDYKIAVKGRIDTGATTTGLNALNIEEFERDGKKWVKFDLPDNNGNPHKIEAKFVKTTDVVQSSMNKREEMTSRIVVKMKIKIGNVSKMAEINLSNRSHMNFPVLIGREFMKDYIVVDVGRDQIHERPKANIFIDKSDLGDPRKNKKSEK